MAPLCAMLAVLGLRATGAKRPSPVSAPCAPCGVKDPQLERKLSKFLCPPFGWIGGLEPGIEFNCIEMIPKNM